LRARDREPRHGRRGACQANGRARGRPHRRGVRGVTALHARLALAGLVRAPGRTLLRLAVVTAAIALLAAMLLFIGNSLRSASASAVRQVPLDWQGPVSSAGQAQRVAGAVARQSGVLQASATATGPFTASTHSGPAGRTTTSNGSVL